MRSRILITLVVVFAATSVAAQAPQQPPSIIHTKVACFLANEKPLLTAKVNTPGTPRVYFRQWGSSEWCYVNGTRTRNDAFVVLPEFPSGIQIEYFFVTWVKDQITGRSSVVYRVPVTTTCEVTPARHLSILTMNCEGAGAVPVGMTGGFNNQDVVVSPSSPEQQ